MALYTKRVREALTGAVNTRQVAEDWAAQHKRLFKADAQGGDPSIRAWLQQVYQAVLAALRQVISRMMAEGWALGQQAATALMEDWEEVDWAGWTPGDYGAAAQVAGAGLRYMLDQADIRIKSIADSRLEELAQVLEDTLASDVTSISPEGPLPPRLSVGDLARQLEDVLDNPSRAELVAWTEIGRAQSEAARQVYAESGYPEVEVITAGDSRVCPVCEAAEALGAHPVGTAPMAPLHPRCRCAEVPVLA